jgi:excisionase family DNA binding protein
MIACRFFEGEVPMTWLNAEEMAQRLKVKASSIRKWRRKHGLPAVRAGRLWRFDEQEVTSWLRARTKKRKNRSATEKK